MKPNGPTVTSDCSTWTEKQLWSRQEARMSGYTDKVLRPTFEFNTPTHTEIHTFVKHSVMSTL